MGKKQQKTDNKSEEVRTRIDDIKKNTSDLERKKTKIWAWLTWFEWTVTQNGCKFTPDFDRF